MVELSKAVDLSIAPQVLGWVWKGLKQSLGQGDYCRATMNFLYPEKVSARAMVSLNSMIFNEHARTRAQDPNRADQPRRG